MRRCAAEPSRPIERSATLAARGLEFEYLSVDLGGFACTAGSDDVDFKANRAPLHAAAAVLAQMLRKSHRCPFVTGRCDPANLIDVDKRRSGAWGRNGPGHRGWTICSLIHRAIWSG